MLCWIGSLVFEEVYGEVSRVGGCLWASIHNYCVMASVYACHDYMHISWYLCRISKSMFLMPLRE